MNEQDRKDLADWVRDEARDRAAKWISREASDLHELTRKEVGLAMQVLNSHSCSHPTDIKNAIGFLSRALEHAKKREGVVSALQCLKGPE